VAGRLGGLRYVPVSRRLVPTGVAGCWGLKTIEWGQGVAVGEGMGCAEMG
jgi:hypothetical protein